MKSSGPLRARRGALAAVAALLALAAPPALAQAATGRTAGAAHREIPQRTPSGAAAPGPGPRAWAGPAWARPWWAGRNSPGGVSSCTTPRHGARRLPSVHASSYVIADAGTGQVLAAKDPHGHFLPASTLKILTADTLMPVLKPGRQPW